jgi:hypothetical protein
MPQSQDNGIKHTLLALAAFYLAQAIIGGGAFFFWCYAVWILLKQDRFLDAAIAGLLAPLGALYGFLRFFAFL